ncbi:hypothetical protein Nepgr_010641 [Nepenthes gracilis]|uniref:Photolyase/cryptochrome alpha/beta domain-containing protein n=1 Tax=Nepenthes gracilis TaxID=150966 RepID=A0AAD3SDK4_NEPGR|nr:hypothetical protein Nepgr_010641 [Nepenthes gracilis]
MALLVIPHKFHYLPQPLSQSSLSLRAPRLKYSSSTCLTAKSERTELVEREKSGAAILWFKHDLRIDDHPGLHAAAKHRTVVPLYVFDHRILLRFSDEMVELVLLAVEDLRKSLVERGSNLMIRFGHAECVIQKLVKEVKATHIFGEEEAEYNMRSLVDIVKDTLTSEPLIDWRPEVVLWRAPFCGLKNTEVSLPSYNDLKKLQCHYDPPLVPPRLHTFHGALNWGALPSIDDVRKFMTDYLREGKESWLTIKDISADSVLWKQPVKIVKSSVDVIGDLGLSQLEGSCQRIMLKNSVFGTTEGNIVAGGTHVVLDALDAYLRYLEGTTRDDWQEVHKRLQETESRKGASFGALFGSALQVGIISRRRVYYEAAKYEKEKNAGFLSSISYSTATVTAAVETVCSMEWYWLLALRSQANNEGSFSSRFWRWNGYLVQYTVVGREGPAVLLVHGFGAFLEHYRDNLCSIADGGNQVWAITLLGFGKSEKPNIVYTEFMWAELLRDFIIEVVGEPVHLIGNSLGGYLVAIVGGLWPFLLRSVVLINTAGNVDPGYTLMLFSKGRKISGAAWLGARLVLQYLKLSLRGLVKSCYPTRTERADDWLIEEMLRASSDPGSIVVLESVFSLNLAIPLNHLLDRLQEKVLVVQGMKDPIEDSYSKVAMFREHCASVMIKELDAGHCPHDECPEEVNRIVLEWIATIESRQKVVGSS